MIKAAKYLIPICLFFISFSCSAQDSLSSVYSTLYNQGAEALSKQDYRSAMSLFDQAVQLNNSYAEAIHARGTCFLMLNEPDKACADFWLALEKNWRPSKEYIQKYCSSSGRKAKTKNPTPVNRVEEN